LLSSAECQNGFAGENVQTLQFFPISTYMLLSEFDKIHTTITKYNLTTKKCSPNTLLLYSICMANNFSPAPHSLSMIYQVQFQRWGMNGWINTTTMRRTLNYWSSFLLRKKITRDPSSENLLTKWSRIDILFLLLLQI
jgi:hypothetical protein